jgi:hypothetical protein
VVVSDCVRDACSFLLLTCFVMLPLLLDRYLRQRLFARCRNNFFLLVEYIKLLQDHMSWWFYITGYKY